MSRPRAAPALLAALLLAGCAARPTHPDAFAFAVLGDVPYNEREEREYHAMLARIDAEPLAFTIHVGDFKGGGACSDALFAKRRAEFDGSAHPFIYTPGDNEWTDCRARGEDPLERLARLREVFFATRRSLGRTTIELSVQDRCLEAGCPCPAHPENRFWTRAGVRFVTLHVVGSGDRAGEDAASRAEARCRDEANAAWLEQAIRASERSETRAMVIAMQANPWHPTTHRRLVAQVQDAARRVGKPVLLVHGDTHAQRVDTPFTDALGNAIARLTRLEVFGSPQVGWVKVTVDPDDPEVFRFEPRLQALVVPPLR